MATWWALLVAPPLCLGGGLVHQCVTCAPGAQCGHEAGCNADPCTLAPVRPDGSTTAPPVAVLPPAVCVVTASPAAELSSLSDGPRGPGANRPERYFETGLPLLN